MAISKERKNELIAQYRDWASRSHALFLAEYSGLTMKDIDMLRSKAREIGGEFHIIKNTLAKLAFESEGYPLSEDYLKSSTAIAFAFDDAPALAKAMVDFARTTEFLKFKGGYLGHQPISGESIKTLADLPPLPVVRANLMGTLNVPSSQVVGIFVAPLRQLISVIKAYADHEAGAVAE